jgi:hypothetical protein
MRAEPTSVRAEPVEAGACHFRPFGLSLSKPWWRTTSAWKTAPGFRPGGRVTFFASPKKVTKGREAGVRSLGEAKLGAHQRRPDCGGRLRRLLCAARPSREVHKLALRAQTCELLFPACPALLDAAHGTRDTSNLLASHRLDSVVDRREVWRSQTSRLLALPLGPVCSAEQPRYSGAAASGRLFFAYFLLAKQKKVSALSGAYPDAVSRIEKQPSKGTAKP